MVLAGLGWLVENQTSFASGRPLVLAAKTESLAVAFTVQDAGIIDIGEAKVRGAFGFYRDYDELNYLLLDRPGTTIDQAEITVVFPRDVDPAHASARAIVVHNGDAGAPVQTNWSDSRHLVYRLQDVGPDASVTLIARVPKGSVQPSFTQAIFGTIRGLPQIIWATLAVILPVLMLGILFVLVGRQISERRRAVDATSPTPPEGLPPALAAVVIDGRVSARAIAATLLDLARREYLQIGHHYDGFSFTKRRQMLMADHARDHLLSFETILLERVFSAAPQSSDDEIRVRIGSSLFSRDVAQIYLALYESATERRYFGRNPSITQGNYRLAGLALFFAGLLGFGFGVRYFADPPGPLLFWAGVMVAALLVIALAPHTSSYTLLGLRERRRWLAFRNYLSSTDPVSYAATNQQQFFAFLPYAVAFGVEVEWARRFVHAPFQTPDWYASKETIVRLEDFANDVFPLVGYLGREMAAVKEPTLS